LKFKNDQIRSIETEVQSTFLGGAKIECAAPKHWKGMRVRISPIEGGE
jgi:hypothetical protein